MFDFGWSHILILLVVALVVVGPKDLPKLMRTAGQWVGRARAMADQFRRSFDDMARQSELDELRNEVNRLKSEATAPITDLDYKNLGIDFPTNPMEEVGAAPAVAAIQPPPAAFTGDAAPALPASPAVAAEPAPSSEPASTPEPASHT